MRDIRRPCVAGGVHPTLINNTESLANAPHILKNGSGWYRALGIGEATGTKLFSLSGDLLNPGLYELPMGTRLEELVFVHGGGMLDGRAFKAVFAGGPSSTLLTARMPVMCRSSSPCRCDLR